MAGKGTKRKPATWKKTGASAPNETHPATSTRLGGAAAAPVRRRAGRAARSASWEARAEGGEGGPWTLGVYVAAKNPKTDTPTEGLQIDPKCSPYGGGVWRGSRFEGVGGCGGVWGGGGLRGSGGFSATTFL